MRRCSVSYGGINESSGELYELYANDKLPAPPIDSHFGFTSRLKAGNTICFQSDVFDTSLIPAESRVRSMRDRQRPTSVLCSAYFMGSLLCKISSKFLFKDNEENLIFRVLLQLTG